jgi:hypothetical protein
MNPKVMHNSDVQIVKNVYILCNFYKIKEGPIPRAVLLARGFEHNFEKL